MALTATGGSGTGAVTFSVTNGTATGCVISGTSLTATTAGTCLVTATKAADTTYTSITSSATSISFAKKATPLPAQVNVGFTYLSSTLNGAMRARLAKLVAKLKAGASVTVTGYGQKNAAVAKARALAVEKFLKSRKASLKIKIALNTKSAVREATVKATKQ